MTRLNQPWMHTAAIEQITTALDNQVRFVGGCVRNALLGIPISDIDMATPLAPDSVMQRLENASIKVIPTGIAYGTVTAIINHCPYEITTLRKDHHCDGRHAQVDFTDNWEEDAQRRDFTINALSCTSDGTVYDYCNGQDDLSNGILRFVGNPNTRCEEDYLRILRLFRFFAYYGKEIETESLAACARYTHQLTTLSGERIHSELFKLLGAPHPLSALQHMHNSGILESLLKHTISLTTIESLLALEQKLMLAPNANRRFCALLFGTDGNKDALFETLRLSNKQKKYCEIILASPLSPKHSNASLKKIFRHINDQTMSRDMVALSWAATAHSQFEAHWSFVNSWKIPTFPLKGQDLLDLGIIAGKELGIILKEAEKWWEANDYRPTKEEIIRHLK